MRRQMSKIGDVSLLILLSTLLNQAAFKWHTICKTHLHEPLMEDDMINVKPSDGGVQNKIPYRPNSQKAVQLILAGLVASVAMVAGSYLLRSFGVLAPDFAAQYGVFLNEGVHPTRFSMPWMIGLLWHFLNTIFIFTFLYDFLAHKRVLPNGRRSKAFLYGCFLWLFSGLVVAPLAGEGLMFRLMTDSFVMAVAGFVCWVVYAVVLDEMTRARIVHRIEIAEKKAA